MALEDAETKIRQVTKNEYFAQTRKTTIDKKIYAIIREALKEIKIPVLKSAAIQSLLNFYNRQYEELRRSFGWQLLTLSSILLLQNKTLTGREIRPTKAEKQQALQVIERAGFEPPQGPQGPQNEGIYAESDIFDKSRVLGSPLQKFSQDYFRQNVKPAFDRLIKQFPKDPGDISGRNSLRNRAEMEVRYNEHLENIENLKQQGEKLVIASSHADCSERCRPWQGRVYSLDGTSGTTDDGRRFVPLETATDIFYTTKAGVSYKNGLLGFNCRHFLVPYKSGYRFPKPNAAEERKQYAITVKQRELERTVRLWKTKAVTYKGTDEEAYKNAKRKAQEANAAYIAYSRKNNRAYDPSRTKLI